MSLCMGLDVGTSRIKALLYDSESGAVLGIGERPTPVVHPRPEWSDSPAEDIWQATVGAIRDLAARAPAVAQTRAVAVSSLGESGVPLDEAGRPLMPFMAWFDERPKPQSARWEPMAQRIYQVTGQRMSHILGVNKYLWLCASEPEVAARTRHWLSMADWIYFRLSGVYATDYTLASRVGVFDQRRRAWSAELLDAAQVPAEVLPQPYPSGTAVGQVSAAAAAETGLPCGAVVVTGGHDHLCAALAGGAVRPGVALDSTGTAGSVAVPVDRFLGDVLPWSSGMSCYAHTAPGLYVVRCTLRTAGGAVAWLVRLLWGREPDDTAYDTLLAEAEAAAGGKAGVFFPPYLLGSGTPVGDYAMHGAVLGLGLSSTRGDIVRALLEGLAFWLRHNLDTLEDVTGQPLTTVRLAGGSTRLELLTRLKATITGRPIQVPEMAEGSALGAALLAGIGAGFFSGAGQALASMQLPERTYEPDPAEQPVYDRLYRQAYREIYPALKPLDSRLHGI